MMSRKKIAVVGAGLSGLACAVLLSKNFDVDIHEKSSEVGGLLKCKKKDGSVFCTCGGHVFNTKNEDVSKLFWSIFNEDSFVKQERNAVIDLGGHLGGSRVVGYPVEDHVWQLDSQTASNVIDELVECCSKTDGKVCICRDLEQYLMKKLGKTLSELHFKPYNRKAWNNQNASCCSEMKRKFPQIDYKQIFTSNILHKQERDFVHSSFYFPKDNGPQFIIDTLLDKVLHACRLHLCSNADTLDIASDGKTHVNRQQYDAVVFCGNMLDLKKVSCKSIQQKLESAQQALQFHGTMSCFCKAEADCDLGSSKLYDYKLSSLSWMYIPREDIKAHRLIFTGNMARKDDLTFTMEYSFKASAADVEEDLKKLPFKAKMLDANWTPCSYPVVTSSSIAAMQQLEEELQQNNIFLCGRFADWKYYNMDDCIRRAIETTSKVY